MTVIESMWWWPKPVGESTIARLRKDYPEESHLSEEAILAKFGYEGHRYEASALWDHVGDAEEDYNKLADHLLRLR